MTYTDKMRRMMGEKMDLHGKVRRRRWSKADYEFVADVLRSCEPSRNGDGTAHRSWIDTCKKFAERLAKLDRTFDRGRFLEACGV